MERTSNRKCEECGSLLVRREKTETNYAFQHRRFCNRKCSCDSRCGWISGNPTKEHIFNNGKNWQSSRSSIRQNAEKVIKLSGRPMICKKCGYTNHVEICHIKSVSSFDKLSSLNEINSLDNLVLLCSNHHWEFDHGLLIL